jgi:hypothetical protein
MSTLAQRSPQARSAETSYEWLIYEEDDHYYDRLYRDHLQPRRA